MPMRRISTSLPRYGFSDDASPLSEGLANAAATLGELWPRLSQIEADKRSREDQSAQRELDRADQMNERSANRDERAASAKERRELWDMTRSDRSAEQQERAAERAFGEAKAIDAKKEQRALWDAEHGAYVGDDPALKTVSTRTAEGFKTKAAPAKTIGDRATAWKMAVDEIGDPEGDSVVEYVMTATGEKRPQVIKKPLSPEDRKDRVRLLNRRTNELLGAPPEITPDDPHGNPTGFVHSPAAVNPNGSTAPATDMPKAKLWDTVPVQPAAVQKPAPATPSGGSGQEQARRQFLAGSGGWGMFPGANFINPTTPPTAEAEPTAPVDPKKALALAGIQPHPDTGITLDDLTSQDQTTRETALMRLPARERLKAIDELLKLGYQ